MKWLLLLLFLLPATSAHASLLTMGAGTTYTAIPPVSDFPDASNTGVPAGTSLTNVSGELLVNSNNTTVSGKNVEDCIIVQATGVVIENSKAACVNVEFGSAAFNTANAQTIIRDSEVNCGQSLGTNPGNSGIVGQNYFALRVDVQDCENGFDAGDKVNVEDSFIHNLYNSAVGDPHTDGIQVWDGDNLTLDNNTWYGFTDGCVYPQGTPGECNGSSVLNINNDPTEEDPPVANVLINHNLVAGGGWAMYCPRTTVSNFVISDNHFSTVYSPNVGDLGIASDCAASGGESASGNVIHETGAPVTF